MKIKAVNALNLGSIGISFGLEYYPGTSTDEVIEICEVVKNYSDRICSIHLRYDADRSLEAIKEVVKIGQETKASIQISHLNSGVCFGYAEEALKMIDKAISEGVNLTADVYPYNAFCTSAGSPVFADGCFKRWNINYDKIVVTDGEYKGSICDKYLFNHIREEHPETSLIAFVMKQKEVDKVLSHPGIMVASDGNINMRFGHPRVSGTFPKVLHKYAKDKSDEELIYYIEKMSKIPANKLGLIKKGEVLEGYDADIVIFNRDEISDNETYDKPFLKPKGIVYVFINGDIAVRCGEIVVSNLGKTIRKK